MMFDPNFELSFDPFELTAKKEAPKGSILDFEIIKDIFSENDQVRPDPMLMNLTGGSIFDPSIFTAKQPVKKPKTKPPSYPQVPTQIPTGYKIEKEFFEDYYRYKYFDDREALRSLIKKLQPIIQKGLLTFGGEGAEILRGKAKLIVKNAIDVYDPTKGKLTSYVMLHLQRLMREAPPTGTVISTSESFKLELRKFEQMVKEFEDELGRPPSDYEIAERFKIPIRKIEKFRRAQGGMVASQYEDASISERKQLSDEAWQLVLDTIYLELDSIDQLILERYYGIHGHQRKTIEEIAREIKKSVGFVHKRLSEIRRKIEEVSSLL